CARDNDYDGGWFAYW
nr:immunoglobulin heavy chain junction region [Mus musculus]NSM04380.1 immunoglobulin heavy chain junction region [Mus musculus]NSM04877.1 immunoglobulin heavy chain junction region [Mus musculus]NSM05120.1 immunoglobulin heavy chain junction region [Mus musculus]NSM05142.1 immunoglobulin heavy chain junction region [Mus musculus]